MVVYYLIPMVFAGALKHPEFYPHGFLRRALKHSTKNLIPMAFAKVFKNLEFHPHGFCEGCKAFEVGSPKRAVDPPGPLQP